MDQIVLELNPSYALGVFIRKNLHEHRFSSIAVLVDTDEEDNPLFFVDETREYRISLIPDGDGSDKDRFMKEINKLSEIETESLLTRVGNSVFVIYDRYGVLQDTVRLNE